MFSVFSVCVGSWLYHYVLNKIRGWTGWDVRAFPAQPLLEHNAYYLSTRMQQQQQQHPLKKHCFSTVGQTASTRQGCCCRMLPVQEDPAQQPKHPEPCDFC